MEQVLISERDPGEPTRLVGVLVPGKGAVIFDKLPRVVGAVNSIRQLIKMLSGQEPRRVDWDEFIDMEVKDLQSRKASGNFPMTPVARQPVVLADIHPVIADVLTVVAPPKA